MALVSDRLLFHVHGLVVVWGSGREGMRVSWGLDSSVFISWN